jgi:predicted DCC family thiol-disulfide oxidoreductase YuxK
MAEAAPGGCSTSVLSPRPALDNEPVRPDRGGRAFDFPGIGDRVETWRFKLLYDGECPFCRIEARWLGYLGRGGSLALEDIAAVDFDPARYNTTLPELMGSLHGVFPNGRKTTGMETFRQAYRAVGLGWLLAPTDWPGLRPVVDWLYRGFARYRVKLGRLFGRTCEGDRCARPEARPVANRDE